MAKRPLPKLGFFGRSFFGGKVSVQCHRIRDALALGPYLAEILSDEELAEAANFQDKERQDAFRLARALVRLELGRRLGRFPAGLAISRDDSGRPFLRQAPRQIFFSISHSAERILTAFSTHGRVGADIEFRSGSLNYEVLARALLPEETSACLLAGPAAELRLPVLKAWCRREAAWKRGSAGRDEAAREICGVLDRDYVYAVSFAQRPAGGKMGGYEP